MSPRTPLKWIAAGSATLVAVAALVWAKRDPDTDKDAHKEPIPLVTVMVADMQSVTSTVTFTGALAARYDMPISAEGEGGRIVEVLSEVGDEVRKGQVLAKLDQSVLRPQVTRLEASLEQARAQAALSLAEFHRVQRMEAIGALSVEEIERRRAASVTDAAKVRVAAAELAETRARLVKTEIRTPQSGRVLTRTAEVGQTASPGAALFRVAGDGEIEMRGRIAERDVAALSVNQTANVYLTGIAKPFKGKVRLLGAVIDPESRQGEIRVALEPDPVLRPGAFARGEVLVSQAQRTVLPQTAVLSDARGTYVLLISEQGTVVRRPVSIANATPDGIVIAEGLKGSERIVKTAGAFLREGERVKIAPNAT